MIHRESVQNTAGSSGKKKKSRLREFRKNLPFLLMALPGAVWLIFFFYIPVAGNVVAFKDFHYYPGGFLESLKNSEWVGWDNFKFLFQSNNAWIITRNTVLYNGAIILFGTLLAVILAVVFSELRSKKAVKVFQTSMMFPYFISWVIISYFVFSFLSTDKGMINNVFFSPDSAINFYTEAKFWPFILIFLGIWKNLGYNSIVYFASIMGINPTYYEAAMVDGATNWQQIKHVTLPQIIPLISIMTILAVGNIFRADFGLFYQIPQNSGAIYNVTSVLDTYIYNGLTSSGDIGMAAAAGLYQSVVGCVLVIVTNLVARHYDPESALF